MRSLKNIVIMAPQASHEESDVLQKSLIGTAAQITYFLDQDLQNFDGLLLVGPSESQSIIQKFHQDGKPIAAIGAAIKMVAQALAKYNPTLAAGPYDNFPGCLLEECPADDYITDRDTKVISTTGFLYESDALKVFAGVSGLAKELVEMA